MDRDQIQRLVPPCDVPPLLREMFDRLWHAYGPQHWWPAQSATEVVIGAILTQNTAWSNVERAIEVLRRHEALDLSVLDAMPERKLADLVRSSGTYRVKARRVKSLAAAVCREFGGSLDRFFSGPQDIVRDRLLAIKGIGPETADAMLLYAGQRASFVVDAYAKRVLHRHFIIPDNADYDAVQSLFHDAMPREVQVFNEYHALLVAVGKRQCRTQAVCEGCPLDTLPHA